MKFLTNNFVLERVCKDTAKEELREWQLQHCKGVENKVVYDIKSCAFCANPTLDFTCYYNYMVLLNQTYDYWKNYGLFDQGYKPLIYIPSFWGNKNVPDTLMTLATVSGINLQRGTGESLMGVRRTAGYSDYWVYKDDLVKLINFAENDFVQKFKIQPKGKFDFGTREPDKVRPTQLIKVYANLEQTLREGV